MERLLREKSWDGKESKEEVIGRGNLSLNSGCCQAVWSIRLCPALDFHVNIPFDKSPLEFGALQQELHQQSPLYCPWISQGLSDSVPG